MGSFSHASKPYVTKLWLGRWWLYLDTRRAYKRRLGKAGWYWGIVSYRKSEGP
jgi:hypothetical protein